MSYMSSEIQGRAGYDSARTETVSKENKTTETRNKSKVNGRVLCGIKEKIFQYGICSCQRGPEGNGKGTGGKLCECKQDGGSD